jgi:hypothetical protein
VQARQPESLLPGPAQEAEGRSQVEVWTWLYETLLCDSLQEQERRKVLQVQAWLSESLLRGPAHEDESRSQVEVWTWLYETLLCDSLQKQERRKVLQVQARLSKSLLFYFSKGPEEDPAREVGLLC